MTLVAFLGHPALHWGALGFGMVVGWNAYFINRYRKDVVIGDLAGLIGAVGGAAVLSLFDAQTTAFGFYGFGLAVGFFGYFVVLLVFVWISPLKTVEFFLGTAEGQKPMFAGEPERKFDPPL